MHILVAIAYWVFCHFHLIRNVFTSLKGTKFSKRPNFGCDIETEIKLECTCRGWQGSKLEREFTVKSSYNVLH